MRKLLKRFLNLFRPTEKIKVNSLKSMLNKPKKQELKFIPYSFKDMVRDTPILSSIIKNAKVKLEEDDFDKVVYDKVRRENQFKEVAKDLGVSVSVVLFSFQKSCYLKKELPVIKGGKLRKEEVIFAESQLKLGHGTSEIAEALGRTTQTVRIIKKNLEDE